MKGCRPLTDQEVTSVFNNLTSLRNKTLFILGCKCGLRISELLSLRIRNVRQNGQIGWVFLEKRNTKGKVESRNVPLTLSAKEIIASYLDSLGSVDDNRFLFKSDQSEEAVTRMQAHRILKDAYRAVGLVGKYSTHTLRKTYCQKVHKALGEDIQKTQMAMGHKSLSSTAAYLQVDREEVEAAIMSLG